VHVLWRFVCERDVWRLEASPDWIPAESFASETELFGRPNPKSAG